MSSGEIKISEQFPIDYFYMTPNLVDDIDMTVYAHRLYCHLKRVTGEGGKCWQSTETLASKTHMSAGMVSKSRKELAEKGLIEITQISNPKGGKDYLEYVVTNIWTSNHKRYSSSPHEVDKNEATSCGEEATSCGEIKNTPVNNTHSFKGASAPLFATELPEEVSQDKNPKPKKERKLSEETIAINQLAQHFSASRKIPIPERTTPRDYKSYSVQWTKPLKKILKMCDNDLDKAKFMIDKVIQKMTMRHLSIKSPLSIEGMAIDLKSELSQEDDGEYRYMGS